MMKFQELSQSVKSNLVCNVLSDWCSEDCSVLADEFIENNFSIGFYDTETSSDGNSIRIEAKYVNIFEYLAGTKQLTRFRFMAKYLKESNGYWCEDNIGFRNAIIDNWDFIRGYPEHFDHLHDCDRLIAKWEKMAEEISADIEEYFDEKRKELWRYLQDYEYEFFSDENLSEILTEHDFSEDGVFL